MIRILQELSTTETLSTSVVGPHRSGKNIPPHVGSLALGLACAMLGTLVAPSSLDADQRGSAKRRGASEARTSTSTPQASIPRSLLPPAGLGSAANVPPGFYRQLDAPAVNLGGVVTHGGVITHGGLVPNIVYVYPGPTYDVAPPQVDTASTPSRAVDPYDDRTVSANPRQEPSEPIYITRQELEEVRERHTPRPVYIVDDPAADSPSTSHQAQPSAATVPAAPVAPKQASAVTFAILPPDASVVLDDDSIGDGNALGGLSDGLMIDPGVHVLEVSHPDYKTQRLVFGVGSGEPMEVIVDLAADTPQRRSRIR